MGVEGTERRPSPLGHRCHGEGESERLSVRVRRRVQGLYARVFDWLVKMCNKTLDQQGISRDYFIGVLDIAGFEIFDVSTFI